MKAELHSEQPDLSLRPRLMELVEDAVSVDIAVAFVTRFGATAIQAIVDELKDPAKVHLLVSVLFPTDLHAIKKLAENIGVSIHLGRDNEAERIHAQFHSKVVLIERKLQSSTIIVGSHNWTKYGLDGLDEGNLEASLILNCVESDPVVGQTRKHIKACMDLSERFDPARMPFYQDIQRKYHHNIDSAEKKTFPGFDRSDGIVILAEDDTEDLGDSGELYFNVLIGSRKQFGMDTPVRIFVFPRRSLFGKTHPLPQPRVYEGIVQNNDRRPSDSQNVGAHSFFISDIAYPCIETVESIPPRSNYEMQVVVPFLRVQQLNAIQLFHGAGEPHAGFALEVAPEHQVYPKHQAHGYARKGTLENERCDVGAGVRMVPTDLIAEMILRVPFTFAYPPTLVASLEAHGRKHLRLPTGVPFKVIVAQPKAMSDYVCSVKYESGPELTKEIYSSPDDSTL